MAATGRQMMPEDGVGEHWYDPPPKRGEFKPELQSRIGDRSLSHESEDSVLIYGILICVSFLLHCLTHRRTIARASYLSIYGSFLQLEGARGISYLHMKH